MDRYGKEGDVRKEDRVVLPKSGLVSLVDENANSIPNNKRNSW